MTALGATSRGPIAVVGATGLQGGATVRALLGANAPVRALARRPDSDAARALTELGADVVAADLDDPESLRAAFTGVDGVFAMTTPLIRPGYELRIDLEVTHGHAIADAAAATSVPHVVYSSVGGAERHTGLPISTANATSRNISSRRVCPPPSYDRCSSWTTSHCSRHRPWRTASWWCGYRCHRESRYR